MSFEFEKFAEYSALEEERTKLAQQAEAASEFTRGIYQSGIYQADARLAALRDDPEFTSRLTELYTPVQNAQAELDVLSTSQAVKSGLIKPETIEQARQSLSETIAASPDLYFAVSYYAGVKVVAGEAELDTDIPETPVITPEAEAQSAPAQEALTEPAPAETEKLPKKLLTITLRGDTLKVGQSGQFIKLSSRTNEAQKDYSTARLKLLEVLIKHSATDKLISASDLWKETFPDQDMDSNTMGAFRNWITRLTYNRKPVVYYNQKRGMGSKYAIRDFEIEYIQRPQRKTPVASTETKKKPAKPQTTPSQSSTEAISAEAPDTPEAESTEYFPLTSYECLVVAEFLRINGDVMQQRGLQKLDQKIVDELRQLPTGQAQKNMIQGYGSVPDARRAFLQNLKSFFEDEERIENAIDTISEDDPRFPIFSYFFEMEGDDRWGLMVQLVDAEAGMDISVLLPKHGGSLVLGVDSFVEVDGERYSRSRSSGTKPAAAVAPEASVAAGESLALEADASIDLAGDEPTIETAVVPAPSEDNPVFAPEEKLGSDSPALSSEAERTASKSATPKKESDPRSWEKPFTKEIGSAINQLKADGLLSPTPVRQGEVTIKRTSALLGTKTAYHRLEQIGAVPKLGNRNPSTIEWEPEHLVTSILLNRHRDGILSKNNKARLKRALQLIREGVHTALDRVEEIE